MALWIVPSLGNGSFAHSARPSPAKFILLCGLRKAMVIPIHSTCVDVQTRCPPESSSSMFYEEGANCASCARTGPQPQGSGFQRRPTATPARVSKAAMAVNTAETSVRTVSSLSCTGIVAKTWSSSSALSAR